MTKALLLVDVQHDMLDPPHAVPSYVEVEAALRSLLGRAREDEALVVHVQNDGSAGDPDEPHTPGWELFFTVAQGELTVRKTESDAFTNPALGVYLDTRHVDQVVVAGMQSNYCVAATCRGARKYGLEVILASGAHATYDEGETADVISRRVEEDLKADGVKVLPASEIWFS